mmetsp:Transcript_11133/g.38765  ORF Transcript_11133/g.38765 Transcript_11133/m.38765 type:complete len:1104 (-) Transcript_11133:194-3505(-)
MSAPFESLLDFSVEEFDVPLLDHVVEVFYNQRHPERERANAVLMQLLEHPAAWTRVDAVLEGAENPAAKFFALQILQDTITYRWGTLPRDQREGIRSYISDKIIALSSDEATLAAERVLVSKLNLSLVAILKQEWPQNWPSFIPDLVDSSKVSQSLCENNMRILLLLSEEVFDFGREAMTSEKVETLKTSLNKEFAAIFELCEFILGAAEQESLLSVTLQTLLRFLSWIPLGYIFETKLVETLCTRFFAAPEYRCDALAALTEIGAIDAPAYEAVFVNLFCSTMDVLAEHIPPESDVAMLYDSVTDEGQTLIQRVALFLCTFLRAHRPLLEKPDLQPYLLQGLDYLVRVSAVPETEIFKICLEYWHAFANELYLSECKYGGSSGFLGGGYGGRGGGGGGSGFGMGGLAGSLPDSDGADGPRSRHLYGGILSRVRLVMISRMAKPEEVLIKEDESGDIVRETQKDTDALAQYKTMREALVFLTHLDYEDTERIMLAKLARQVDGAEWGWNALNTLCWAVGSVSGAMGEEDEKRFVVTVIKDLLRLCEMKKGKNNKAVIASCIMYVVGQYPRFLRKHWKFLKTVVNKLFEFMHERHPGVQDMACDTFVKIASKCKRMFVLVQAGEARSFADELVDGGVAATIDDLEIHQVHSFYEAVGFMVSAQPDPVGRASLLERLMSLPNGMWQRRMNMAAADVTSLHDPDAAREIQRILRSNVSVCRSVGASFGTQMGKIFLDMLNVYAAYAAFVSSSIEEVGPHVVGHSVIKLARLAKAEALALVQIFVEKADPSAENVAELCDSFLPPFLETVLTDFAESEPVARDPEVLTCLTAIVVKLRDAAASPGVAPRIMEAVFDPVLGMITENMDDSPDMRLGFYKLLEAVNQHAFGALFDAPPERQKLIVDAVVWGVKHTKREVADVALGLLARLLDNVVATPELVQGFFSAHLLSILQDVLFVLTDRMHKSGFKMQTTILRQLFTVVEAGHLREPLFDPAELGPDAAGMTNSLYLRTYVRDLLASAFENLSAAQVEAFVEGLCDLSRDVGDYKTLVRDFLIEILEFRADDNLDLLYAEEAETAAAEADKAELERAQAVPGLLRPADMDDDDDL